VLTGGEDDGRLEKADGGDGKTPVRLFTSWRRRRHEHTAPATSSRPGGDPE
jgi:hypothetical protein